MAIPSSDSGLDADARGAAIRAKAGSARLRIALLRYGMKHGLPNLTPAQCRAALCAARRKGPRARRAAPAERMGMAGRDRAAPRAAGSGEGDGRGACG